MHAISDRILAWLDPDKIEPAARQQLVNTAEMPFVFKHLAVMPDCHLGMGATVGSVIATKGAIMPAAVGVDIGCGMVAVQTRFTASQLPDNLQDIHGGILRRIPVSAGVYNTKLTDSAIGRLAVLADRAAVDYRALDGKWSQQLGTLGGGNHFIEVCLDENDTVWAVLHSGSRGIGNKITNKHIRIAKRLMEEGDITLKDRDLAYLSEGQSEFTDYIRDMLWAQEFARMSRDEMMDRVMVEMSYAFYGEDGHQAEIELQRINCHHNFTQQEQHFGHDVWVTRKGAIQMQLGQKGVIPGSMGTRSYIVSGLANPLSFHSAPHGAGRRFSRTEARRRFTMADFESAMAGIVCQHDPALLDEIPGAYKDIDEVMENSRELVRVEHTLQQVLNVKGK